MSDTSSKKARIRLVLDAMGGDHAPGNEIEGAVEFAKSYGNALDYEIIFIGKESIITDSLKKYDTSSLNFRIVNADEVVAMGDDPVAALKTKKQSSIYKALEMIRDGEADAFISAGNTGAMLSFSTVILGRLKGVSRPTIGSFFPTASANPVLVVDVGANAEVRPQFLYEFGIMGSIYVEHILGIKNPTVGLLNIGEEKSKGTEVVQEAYKIMQEGKLNFKGNVEGRDILKGTTDVVVCDGFTGNIILKFAESFLPLLKNTMRGYAGKGLMSKIKVGAVAPVLKDVLKQLDYQEYGGVPLLGVKGVVIIGHGSSSPKALMNMIKRGAEVFEKGINKKIEDVLNK